MKRIIYTISIVTGFLFLSPKVLHAQQNCDWGITITDIKDSDCEASGEFTVKLTGKGAKDLTGVLYSYSPLVEGGSVAYPGTNNIFTQVKKGSYTVKVEALCGTEEVVRTMNVTIGGRDYVAPSFTATASRHSLDCGAYGRITVTLSQGNAAPFKIRILNYPVAYTGPFEFESATTNYVINDLPAGTYGIQVSDNCNFTATTRYVSVKSLSLSSALNFSKGNINLPDVDYFNCNIYRISSPTINTTLDPDWAGYSANDGILTWGVTFSSTQQPNEFFPISSSGEALIKLPDNKTYKDYYGLEDFLTVYIKSPCGEISSVQYLNYSNASKPVLSVSINDLCDGFSANINLGSFVLCYPVKVTINGKDYNFSSPSLRYATTDKIPYGSYNAAITTADGHTYNQTFSMSQSSQSSYTMTVNINNAGLNGRIYNFTFQHSTSTQQFQPGDSLILLSGPSGMEFKAENETAGYWFRAHGTDLVPYVSSPSSSLQPAGYYFTPGTYQWRIKTACQTYDFSPITIGPSSSIDVYSYTVPQVEIVKNDCDGMVVRPTGTYTYKGITYPSNFKIVYISGLSYPTGVIASGETFTLTNPAEYKIAATASTTSLTSWGEGNMAISSPINYEKSNLSIDWTVSQGFVCVGSNDNEGQISVKATNGIQPYNYILYTTQAEAESDLTHTGGFARNQTGIFQNEGLMRNTNYYVKIVDDCGSSYIQEMLIYDLATTQKAWSNNTLFCEGDTLELHAIALPDPTYTWYDPSNTLISNNKDVSIPNLTPTNGYVNYTVEISTNYCNTAIPVAPVSIKVNAYGLESDIDIVPSADVCDGDTYTMSPSAPTVQNPVFYWYDAADAVNPIAVGTSFTTPALSASTTYYLAVSGDNKCETLPENRKLVTLTVISCISAADDYATIFECSEMLIPILANDDFDGNTFTIVKNARYGTASVVGDRLKYENGTLSVPCEQSVNKTDTVVYAISSGSFETTANAFIRLLKEPEIILDEPCSINPQLILSNNYTDFSYKWEYSKDGNTLWAVIYEGTDSKLNITEDGFYRLSITYYDGYEYNIHQVSKGAEITINKKRILPGGILWYDMSLNPVTVNW